MKRVHLLEPGTALAELNGVELCVAPLPECERADCDHDHYFLIPELELVDLIAERAEDALKRLGLSGRAVS